MVTTPSHIEDVYEYIRVLHRKRNLELAIDLGRYVIDELIHGKIAEWRTVGKSHDSIRALARRIGEEKGASISPTTLYRCLHVYEMDDRLTLRQIPAVTLAHAIEALAAPAAEQLGWLQQVAPNGWSSRQLGAAIRAKHPKRKRKRSFLAHVRRLAEFMSEDALALVPTLTAEELDAAKKQLDVIRERLTRYEAAVDAALGDADATPGATPAVQPADDLPPEPEAPAAEEAPAAQEAPSADEPASAEPERALVTDLPPNPATDGADEHHAAHTPLTGRQAPSPRATGLDPHLARAAQRPQVHLRFSRSVEGMLDLCRSVASMFRDKDLLSRTTVALGGTRPCAEVAPALNRLWQAYCVPEPMAWLDVVKGGLPEPLPALAWAWLEELPHPVTGLGATEAALLDAAAQGQVVRDALRCRPGVYDEEATGALLLGLARAGAVRIGDGEAPAKLDDLLDARLDPTALGAKIAANGDDYLRHAQGTRCWGGTQITQQWRWRYDPKRRVVLVPPGWRDHLSKR